MDAFLAVLSKREIRDYAARPLEPEIERRILDAGRVAGSAKNRQPWTFLVVREDRAVEAVAESVYEPTNIRGAAFLVAIQMSGGAGIDAGRAAQNMMLAAHAHGVGSCPNGISDRVGLSRATRRGAAPRNGSSGPTASPTRTSSESSRDGPARRGRARAARGSRRYA